MSRKRNSLPDGQSVLSIRLPAELYDQLKLVAKANDRAAAQEARRALALHIEAELAGAA